MTLPFNLAMNSLLMRLDVYTCSIMVHARMTPTPHVGHPVRVFSVDPTHLCQSVRTLLLSMPERGVPKTSKFTKLDFRSDQRLDKKLKVSRWVMKMRNKRINRKDRAGKKRPFSFRDGPLCFKTLTKNTFFRLLFLFYFTRPARARAVSAEKAQKNRTPYSEVGPTSAAPSG